jgi:electron transport complex protein RnfD
MLALEGDVAALVNIAAALLGSVIAELCMAIPDKKNSFGDGVVILAGLLTGLLLPTTLSPFIALGVSFSGFLIARVLFGGTGSYWLHPVATSVCIAFISQSAAFPQVLVSADGMRIAGDAFSALKMDHFTQIASDQTIATNLNSTILGFFGIKLPEGYITLFGNSPSVIPAFRYNIITLASSIILLAMNIIEWVVPCAFLLTYALCVRFFSLLPFGYGFSGGNILFALLTSGVLFIAFYLLTDFSTMPRTRTGKTISGIFAGFFAFLLCGPGGSSAGGVFTVFLVNIINPAIEYCENRIIASAEDIA